MASMHSSSSSDDYDVRPYRTDDREGFLALYESVWDTAKGRAWFDWRFEQNPFRDDVAMIVAERDGDIVGTEPLLALPLRVGARELAAFQPVDWMVHPEHRRCGLFTRMTEAVLDRFADEASLLFNFPNDQLLPGLEKFDWRTVGPAPTSYRVQNASAVVSGRSDGSGDDGNDSSGGYRTLAPAVARVGTPLLRQCLDVLDHVGSPPSGVAVESSVGVPVDTVHDLYTSNRPERVHVSRDLPYLRWRFSNPRWDTRTYVARRGGEVVASAITVTEHVGPTEIVRLVDVQPMGKRRPTAFRGLLDGIVADAESAAMLAAPARCYPKVLRRNGFLADDGFPLSRIASTSTHVVRPLGDDGQQPDGQDAGADRSGAVHFGAARSDAADSSVDRSDPATSSVDRSDAADSSVDRSDAASADSGGSLVQVSRCESSSSTVDETVTTPTAGSDGTLLVDGRDLTDPDEWLLALGDRDLA